MRSRTAAFALVLGALSAGSCLIYDKNDISQAIVAGNGGGSVSGRGGSADGGGGLATAGATGGSLSGGGNLGGGGSTATGGGGTSGGPEAGAGGDDVMGGTAGTAGAAGRAGGSGGTGGTPVVRPELIDDCDDGNQFIRPVDQRTGLWYTFVTGKGVTVTPTGTNVRMTLHPAGEVGQPEGSRYAFHFTATGATAINTGAAGLDLMQPAPRKLPYDASAYKGISFYARAAAPVDISVRFPVAKTERNIAICSSSASGAQPNQCDDHFRYNDLRIGVAWAKHQVLFEDTAQEGWGQNGLTALTADALVSIHFVVASNADLWIDEVAFVPTSE